MSRNKVKLTQTLTLNVLDTGLKNLLKFWRCQRYLMTWRNYFSENKGNISIYCVFFDNTRKSRDILDKFYHDGIFQKIRLKRSQVLKEEGR